MASDTRPPAQREKVALRPGFHLADWFRLSAAKKPIAAMKRIPRKELQLHNTQFDCWTAYNGKVYDITNYLPYHPGGEAKLMLGAGRDCTQLFTKYHAWVNAENILGKCCIGILINDEDVVMEEEDDDVEKGDEGKDA